MRRIRRLFWMDGSKLIETILILEFVLISIQHLKRKELQENFANACFEWINTSIVARVRVYETWPTMVLFKIRVA